MHIHADIYLILSFDYSVLLLSTAGPNLTQISELLQKGFRQILVGITKFELIRIQDIRSIKISHGFYRTRTR